MTYVCKNYFNLKMERLGNREVEVLYPWIFKARKGHYDHLI